MSTQPPKHLPVFIVLDTNWYIYLCQSKYDKIFAEISEKIMSGSVRLVVCEHIITEWLRNNKFEDKMFIKEIESEYYSARGLAKQMEPEDAEVLRILIDKYADTEVKRIDNVRKRIQDITNLIDQYAYRAPITPTVQALVLDHSLKKKAPMHNNKNSVADAIIFFSAYEYIKQENKFEFESYFISFNHLDFSDPSNKNLIHPDLKQFSDEIKMIFDRNVGSAFQLAKKQIDAIDEYLFQEWDKYYEWEYQRWQAINSSDTDVNY